MQLDRTVGIAGTVRIEHYKLTTRKGKKCKEKTATHRASAYHLPHNVSRWATSTTHIRACLRARALSYIVLHLSARFCGPRDADGVCVLVRFAVGVGGNETKSAMRALLARNHTKHTHKRARAHSEGESVELQVV